MAEPDDFEAVRRDPDPIRRGRRAGELLTIYQQRATELARLRRAAIEQAYRERAMSFTEIAKALGLSKGRITQIRTDAPPPERAFFGVGPVTIAIPHRYGIEGRALPVIAAEDVQTATEIEQLVSGLALSFTRVGIGPETDKPPMDDAVVICGPKSARVGAALLADDPVLTMIEHERRWWITNRETGERYGSPSDDVPARTGDLAYLSRRRDDDRVLVHIAGLHAVGSLGVASYLAEHLSDLYAEALNDDSFSAAVECEFDGLLITQTRLLAGPFAW